MEQNISRANGRGKGKERRGPGGAGEKIYGRYVICIYTCIKTASNNPVYSINNHKSIEKAIPKEVPHIKVQLSVQTDVTEISPKTHQKYGQLILQKDKVKNSGSIQKGISKQLSGLEKKLIQNLKSSVEIESLKRTKQIFGNERLNK